MLVLLLFASIADPLADRLAPALPEDDSGGEDFAQGLAGSREGPLTTFSNELEGPGTETVPLNGPPEQTNNKSEDTRKRKRRQGSTGNSTRRKGDNMLQHYMGAHHQLLVVLILRLRRHIACEDAFPCPLDYSVMAEMMFAEEVQRPTNRNGMRLKSIRWFSVDSDRTTRRRAGAVHCRDQVSGE